MKKPPQNNKTAEGKLSPPREKTPQSSTPKKTVEDQKSTNKVVHNDALSPLKSRLIPYSNDIIRWRKDGKSYREISELHLKEKGLKIGNQRVQNFVKVRSKHRPYAILDSENESVSAVKVGNQEGKVTLDPHTISCIQAIVVGAMNDFFESLKRPKKTKRARKK